MNSFGYNVATSHFTWSRQNFYLLCTFQFAYNGMAYNVNSNTTVSFLSPRLLYVLFACNGIRLLSRTNDQALSVRKTPIARVYT